jgi:hypothetical protein
MLYASLAQLIVPGSDQGDQFPNVLSKWFFVSLYNLFCDTMWLEYVVTIYRWGSGSVQKNSFCKIK